MSRAGGLRVRLNPTAALQDRRWPVELMSTPAVSISRSRTLFLRHSSLVTPVRNATINGARTVFFSGATVQDIAEKVPDILNSYPGVDRIILHIGTNDTTKQQSELL